MKFIFITDEMNIYEKLIKSEFENKQFREYQKYDWKEELYFISNLLIDFDQDKNVSSKIIKNIIYDENWYIYDTFFSWNLLLSIEKKSNLSEEELDTLTNEIWNYFSEYQNKINAMIQTYWIKEENVHYLRPDYILFDEREKIDNELYITIITNNLSDYKLLPKEVIHSTSLKKDLFDCYDLNSILSIYSNSNKYSEINFLNNSDSIIDQIFDEQDEVGVQEKLFNVTKLIMSFSLKLKIWTKKELINVWLVSENIFKKFFTDDVLTDENDLYWVLFVKIPNEYIKQNWEIQVQNENNDWFLYMIKTYKYNNFEHMKLKVKDIFIKLWIEQKDSLCLDWEVFELNEWFFLSKKFLTE